MIGHPLKMPLHLLWGFYACCHIPHVNNLAFPPPRSSSLYHPTASLKTPVFKDGLGGVARLGWVGSLVRLKIPRWIFYDFALIVHGKNIQTQMPRGLPRNTMQGLFHLSANFSEICFFIAILQRHGAKVIGRDRWCGRWLWSARRSALRFSAQCRKICNHQQLSTWQSCYFARKFTMRHDPGVAARDGTLYTRKSLWFRPILASRVMVTLS